MEGFHRLEWMDYYVTQYSPGVYLLSNDGEVVLDLGRSDNDIATELKSKVDGRRGIESKYAYFWFKYADNAFEAYQLHCKLWHHHRRNGSDTHPLPPQGENWSCPVDGCEFHGLKEG